MKTVIGKNFCPISMSRLHDKIQKIKENCQNLCNQISIEILLNELDFKTTVPEIYLSAKVIIIFQKIYVSIFE